MKKFVWGALILSGMALMSCEPWEDETYHDIDLPVEEESSIPGTWKLTDLRLEEAYDFNGDGNSSNSLMSETGCYQNELMEFAADFSGIATSNSYAHFFIDNESFSFECIEEFEETTFSWNQTGNSVNITVDGVPLVATLSGNTLTYIIPEGFFVGDDEGGVQLLQDMTFVYTKQL
ncbi:MAG: hypothetical protein GX159_07660 [Flavobacteriaceae bacterium]|jgi:hypothetical protein|nr:hypothetical protein [Flavobacteriaceae bacterium]